MWILRRGLHVYISTDKGGYMQNFIIVRILRVIGGKFNGYKTILGGIGFFCLGILQGLPLLIPDIATITGTEGNLTLSMASFTAAFAAWGFGGKLEKNKKAVEEQTRTIKAMRLPTTETVEPEEQAGGYRKPNLED